jgi:two-component system, chemotaxis family, sensor kinase CheA
MSGTVGDGIDMSQFYQVFFDEAAEHLASMESLLLAIDINAPEDEQLNAIFRAAHSIKGGAATFGFQDVTSLTHEMETVFDKVRKHEMQLTSDLVDAFLASGDMLNGLLAHRRGDGMEIDAAEVSALCERLQSFLDAGAAGAAIADVVPKRTLELAFGPFDDTCKSSDVDGVIGDLADFGKVKEVEGAAGNGGTDAGASEMRRFHIQTEVSVSDLADTLGFMFAPEKIKVTEVGGASQTASSVPRPSKASEAAPQADAGDADFGFFVDPANLPANQPEKTVASAPKVVELKAPPKPAAAQSDSASIRVSVQKVDQLINLVGELVITQAMLAQTASKADPVLYESLFNGLATLERNTRDLQESAMSIRMMPMSFVFSRFPRVVRDTAAKLGKEVDLHTVGEGTELDKGLIERITDPLTHLIRNSLDHGLESPEEREAKGKVRRGTITLRAYHQGGAIVIEVSDDGRGLRRDKILAKAKERGMAVSDSMSDQEVWSLIFEAGFSTADQVTDVSGRGVGMDVVRRNIQEMGGRVEIESTADIGTRISIKLPLTLAILDGMSVRIGREIFILPLSSIAESLQPQPGSINSISGRGMVVSVRGEYLPVISLAEVCGMSQDKRKVEEGILVILESEGEKTALFVDDLVGQHQVVIKSLETNYRKVAGISGATIMGDGRVALILDVAYIVGLAHSRLDKAA